MFGAPAEVFNFEFHAEAQDTVHKVDVHGSKSYQDVRNRDTEGPTQPRSAAGAPAERPRLAGVPRFASHADSTETAPTAP